jgi:hypothetical protein
MMNHLNHHYDDYYTGLNLPPWWTIAFPGLGVADWAGKGAAQKLHGKSFWDSPSTPTPSFDWAGVAKVGLVVGGVVGVYFIYRSFRGAARTSVSAMRGAME